MISNWQFVGGRDRTTHNYFGFSTSAGKCSCGAIGKCDNLESEALSVVRGRACSCDLADQVARMDAGTMGREKDLPVWSFSLGGKDAQLNMTLGSLICAHRKFSEFP